MPITIDGAGTITGLSAGGLPDASVTTADIANLAVTAGKLETSVASGVAKAWVNFNGTGTIAIRQALNVSSITDGGVGRYTLNFTTAMPTVNYGVSSACQFDTTDGRSPRAIFPMAYNTTSLRINAASTAGSEDLPYINVAIFG